MRQSVHHTHSTLHHKVLAVGVLWDDHASYCLKPTFRLAVARKRRLSVQQLSYGQPLGRGTEQRRTRWDSGIGYEDRDVFDAYLKLPVPQRRLIRETILTFAKVHSELEVTSNK